MHREQREQVRALLRANGVDAALFAHPHSITWLTGFAPPFLTGINPFAGAPPLLWYADGRFTLVVVDAWAATAAQIDTEPDCDVLPYLGYTIERPIDGGGQLQQALAGLWPARSGRGGRLGVEIASAPAAVYAQAVAAWAPASAVQAIDSWLLPLRMVKTSAEIDKLRANFHLTDVGLAAARAAARPDASEIDVWNAAESAVQQAAGERVPVGNDCVVGYREANIGGWPLDYRLRPGDSIIVDLSTIQHGYWSDSCATFVAGEPGESLRRAHRVVAEALELGASLLRPGAVCADIDRSLREFIAGAGYPVYPHHSGHGVGVSGHELPRLVPYSRETLAPGMVIMLEPGIYFPAAFGVRLEDAFLITGSGAERLTRHRKELV